MKLLVIGTDVSIFQAGSEARGRIEAYGRLFDELNIIIYTPRWFNNEILAPGVRLYPTNSLFFFLRPFRAFQIGRKIIRERGIDMISVQDPAECGLAGWLLKISAGLPLHIQIHADFFSPHFKRNSWKERLRYWLASFIIRRGYAFRAVSQRIKRSLESRIKNYESRVMVLPIFVDRGSIAAAKPNFNLHEKYPEFDFIILMVSRLAREKNIGLALEAFRRLIAEFPKTGLVIVGDGPERRNLQLTTNNLQLTDNVRFEGWQSDTISYYKTADLYLLTSNFEGYARSVVEAAAAGSPIVMTDVGVAGEIIRNGETGRIVGVGDAQALFGALLEARRNYPVMKDMAERAKREMLAQEPKTWEEYLIEYNKSYEDILRYQRPASD